MHDDTEALSLREREVAQMLLQGWTQKQMAATLHVSSVTVSAYLSHIHSKLRVNSKVEALRKLRLVDPSPPSGALGDEGSGGA